VFGIIGMHFGRIKKITACECQDDVMNEVVRTHCNLAWLRCFPTDLPMYTFFSEYDSMRWASSLQLEVAVSSLMRLIESITGVLKR